MYPWRRVLIPTDFSTASQWAFDDAIRMAGSTGAELIILHVRMTRVSQPTELRFPADDALYEYAEGHELAMLQERAHRANASVPIRLLVSKAPDPGAEICRVAAEEGVDLVVISTHARHHVAHLIIGSTTLSVIANPPAPVLAIRYGARRRDAAALRRILVPVHMRQKGHHAADLAAAIGRRNNIEIHLLTVSSETERQDSMRFLETLRTGSFAGLESRAILVTGSDVTREVVRYTESIDADIVFINAPTDHKELSMIERELIRRLPAPVMVVP